jgi:hypothetical protein
MSYLDYDILTSIETETFRHRIPYPWINPAGVLTEPGYRRLLETQPGLPLFETNFGKRRAHGQPSHDRYTLEYRDELEVAQPWKELVAELNSEPYLGFLRRLFAVRTLELNFHWHYTPNGCSVSPHCDAKHKLGSHIFYLNTPQDWDPHWGGETLVLDDGGRLSCKSAPAFEDFDRVVPSETLGNRSLLFARTDHSWHGVSEIRCPEGALRKVFIVVVNKADPVTRLRRRLKHTF